MFNELFDNVYKNDFDFQYPILKEIAENKRKTKIDVNILLEMKAFYVPTEGYIVKHFGEKARRSEYNLYFNNGEMCRFFGRLVFPIYNFLGDASSIVGWDNGEIKVEGETYTKYLYQSDKVWNKSEFMFIDIDQYKKAVEDGYIFIVDGIFDMIVLRSMGYNAVSLMGSNLSNTVRLMLKQIKHKIVIPDQDTAGEKFARRICALPGGVSLSQREFNDIDDFLRSDENKNRFRETFELMISQGFILNQVIKPLKKSNFFV